MIKKLRAAGVPKDLDWVAPESLRAYDEMGDPSTTAQVHPYQFTTSMAELAREKGVDIKERSPVTKINYTADGSAVESVTYTDSSTSGQVSPTSTLVEAGDENRHPNTTEANSKEAVLGRRLYAKAVEPTMAELHAQTSCMAKREALANLSDAPIKPLKMCGHENLLIGVIGAIKVRRFSITALHIAFADHGPIKVE